MSGIVYGFCPFDLVPDSVPVLGHSDEVAILVLGLFLAKRAIPADIIGEHSAFLDTLPNRRHGRPPARKTEAEVAARHIARLYSVKTVFAALLGGIVVTELTLRKLFQLSLSSIVTRDAVYGLLTLFVGSATALAVLDTYAALTNARPAAKRAPRPAGRNRLPGLFDIMGYRRRWQILSLVTPARVFESAPVVIGGCGRSGTTLLQAILSNHPAIFSGPESTVFLTRVTHPGEIDRRFGLPDGRTERLERLSRSQAEFVELFQREILRRSGKTVWVEKTPKNVWRLDFIFAHFPNARFVHVIRDGRDVACSLRRQTWMKLDGLDPASPDALLRCIDYWIADVEAGRKYRDHPRYIEVGYLDLVTDTERTLRRLMAFLGADWSPQLLESPRLEETLAKFNRAPGKNDNGLIHTTTVGRWRSEFSERERAIFKERAGALLIELGFEADSDW